MHIVLWAYKFIYMYTLKKHKIGQNSIISGEISQIQPLDSIYIAIHFG